MTIGVLGGMGPEASAEFHRQLIRRNPAAGDQDHFRILVLDDPHIPDRTLFIQGTGQDPRPALKERARQLESYGASFIAIPCNTAHVFWEDIQESVSIPVLHIVNITANSIPPDLKRIAVLSTRGTSSGGLYSNALRCCGLEPFIVDETTQHRVDSLIAGAKSGRDRASLVEGLQECCRAVANSGAGGAILGCTELGLLTDGWTPAFPLFDSLGILAEATLAEARRLEEAPPLRVERLKVKG